MSAVPMTAKSDRPLSILVTNITLSGRTGTEIVTRDLCTGLQARGHSPIVYVTASNADGPIALELRRAGISVVTRIDDVPADIDVIHSHHTPVAAVALCRFPDVPAVFVAHDYVAWFDSPPLFPSIRCYAAVDTTVAERLGAETGWEPDRILLLLNSVDMSRFRVGPPLPPKPRRALAFAKNHGHVQAIESACRARGIELHVVGHAVGKVIDAPEAVLSNYDLVFASALSALEAMACGRAVVVCDGRGLAGYVTRERAERWRPQNFGLRCLARRVETGALLAELDSYDPVQSVAATRYIREHADREHWLDQVEAIHRGVLAAPLVSDRSAVELAAARHMERWSPRLDASWPWIEERNALVGENERLRRNGEAPSLGVRYGWNDAIATSRVAALQGFSLKEEWGTWTVADKAVAMLQLPAIPNQHDLTIGLEFMPFAPIAWPALGVAVSVNGRRAAVRRFTSMYHCRPVGLDIFCPAEWLSDPQRAWLTIDIRNARAPSDYDGTSTDSRRLGIGVIGVTYSAVPRRSRWRRYSGRRTRL
jgi:hypothetical protein